MDETSSPSQGHLGFLCGRGIGSALPRRTFGTVARWPRRGCVESRGGGGLAMCRTTTPDGTDHRDVPGRHGRPFEPRRVIGSRPSGSRRLGGVSLVEGRIIPVMALAVLAAGARRRDAAAKTVTSGASVSWVALSCRPCRAGTSGLALPLTHSQNRLTPDFGSNAASVPMRGGSHGQLGSHCSRQGAPRPA